MIKKRELLKRIEYETPKAFRLKLGFKNLSSRKNKVRGQTCHICQEISSQGFDVVRAQPGPFPDEALFNETRGFEQDVVRLASFCKERGKKLQAVEKDCFIHQRNVWQHAYFGTCFRHVGPRGFVETLFILLEVLPYKYFNPLIIDSKFNNSWF